MSCSQAHSQAIVQGINVCYLFCAACNLCDLGAYLPQLVSCSQRNRGRGLYSPIVLLVLSVVEWYAVDLTSAVSKDAVSSSHNMLVKRLSLLLTI